MTEEYRPDNTTALPDSSMILNGCVPAKWSRKLEETTSGSKQNYSFFPTTTKGNSQFEFSWNSKKSSNAEDVVVCELCPHACKIAPGQIGRCSARVNINGKLYAKFYGRPVSMAVDPIEKKPLYHFLPGTPILSLGTRGCNLSCKFCQNWQISQPLPKNATINSILEPRQVVNLALRHNCPSVAFTYNEPTIWAEYVVDVSRLCRQNGIKTVAVTNGMISGSARRDFYNAVDAVNVDLKSFTDSFYTNLTGGKIEEVKTTLKYVARETHVWLEITNLLIPKLNDSSMKIKEMSCWIAEEVGPFTPVHFSAFFPAWRLTDIPPTPIEELIEASQIAKECGLKHVYCGNVRDTLGQTTYCAKCKSALIARSGFKTTLLTDLIIQSTQASCARCGEPLQGVFQRAVE